MAGKRTPCLRSEMRTVHLYFGAQDADLLLLQSKRFLPEAIRIAVRRYLTNDTSYEIPLLPYAPQPAKAKHISVYFYVGKDDDIIEFIDGIPDGNVNQVMKVLLRHAFAQPDLRQWMDPSKELAKRSRRTSEEVQAAKMVEEKPKAKPKAEPNPAFELESGDGDLEFRNKENPFDIV